MARIIDDPQPGFFVLRLVRRGPLVPAIIYRPCPLEMHNEWWQWLDRWPHLEAMVLGEPASVDRVWTWGRPVPKHEYAYLLARASWANTFGQNEPLARPSEKIVVAALPPAF